MIRFILLVIFVATLSCKAIAEERTIVLENQHLALSVGTEGGAIRSIYDKDLDIHYKFEGLAFEISTNERVIKGLSIKKVQQSPDKITLNFETPKFLIDLVYSLGPRDGFVEKWNPLQPAE